MCPIRTCVHIPKHFKGKVLHFLLNFKKENAFIDNTRCFNGHVLLFNEQNVTNLDICVFFFVNENIENYYTSICYYIERDSNK